MFRVLYLVCLGPGTLASLFRRADPDLANALNPLNPVDVRMKDDLKNMPLRCESHADCGWAEYCGWHPAEIKQKELAARCQACVGCVEPESHNGNSQYFVAYGVALAPVTGKCPDCDERARVGKQSQRPAQQKIVTQVPDEEAEKLRKQKEALERELEHVRGSIYDINVDHQSKEQALEDEIQTLRRNLEAHKVAAPMTTTTSTTTAKAKAGGGDSHHTYNTYNIYNTYNTQHTYNSNGHTFNSWSNCQNVSDPLPMGVEQMRADQVSQAGSASLLRLRFRRQAPGLPPMPALFDPNCSAVIVD